MSYVFLIISRDCLKGTILHSQEAQVKCPFVDDEGECEEYISEREIRKVKKASRVCYPYSI